VDKGRRVDKDARHVAEAALREGAAAELRASREEIRTDVSPLFLAAGNGDVALVRALLVSALLRSLLRLARNQSLDLASLSKFRIDLGSAEHSFF
jgi:hypothetical protein